MELLERNYKAKLRLKKEELEMWTMEVDTEQEVGSEE